MKLLLSLAVGLGLAVACLAPKANAADVAAPEGFNMITLVSNAIPWTMPASNGATVAVNMSLTQAPWIPVGADGFSVTIKAYATNAALTTNVWFTLETSSDRVNANTNNNLTVVYLPTGVATNSYHTNFYIRTSALLGNISAVRVKNFMQTNGVVGGSLAGNLFVQKFRLNTR